MTVPITGSVCSVTGSVESCVICGSSLLQAASISIDSAKYDMPLNSNITINANSGTITMEQDAALAPGVEIYVAQGATLKIMIPGHNAKDANLWQNKVVEQFKAQYPDVTVQFVTATWKDWYEKVLAAYQSGDPIDLIHDGVNNNPRFALNNITQPIDPYVDMTNPNLKSEVMNEIFTYGGKHYVAASEVNVAVLYYNKNLFQQEGLEDPA